MCVIVNEFNLNAIVFQPLIPSVASTLAPNFKLHRDFLNLNLYTRPPHVFSPYRCTVDIAMHRFSLRQAWIQNHALLTTPDPSPELDDGVAAIRTPGVDDVAAATNPNPFVSGPHPITSPEPGEPPTWNVPVIVSFFVAIVIAWALFFFHKWRHRPRETARQRAERFERVNEMMVHVYRNQQQAELDRIRRQLEQISMFNGVTTPPALAAAILGPGHANIRFPASTNDATPPTPPLTIIDPKDLATSETEDEHCVICLEPLVIEGDSMAASPCGHILHEKCLRQWMTVDRLRACPICRVGSVQVEETPAPE